MFTKPRLCSTLVLSAVLTTGLLACNSSVTVEPTSSSSSTSTGDTTSSSTGAQGGAPTGSGGAGAAGGGPIGCTSDSDCTGDPAGPLCDPATGSCAACLTDPDPALDCGIGQFCNPAQGQCQSGCSGDVDCPSAQTALICDLDSHACVECLGDSGCPVGSICLNAQCLPGCSPEQACPAGKTCCGQQCYDADVDVNNCGMCNHTCDWLPNSVPVCTGGQCAMGPCTESFADCNGQAFDGCEHNTLADGPCACVPGETEACYAGALGTKGIGVCKAGARTCAAAGNAWGPCLGQVLPAPEICANGLDENCNGAADEPIDFDFDGWTTCDGDCDDTNKNVNPGALEIVYKLVDDDLDPMTPPVVLPGGNGLDDDCNPATPDTTPPPSCSSSPVLSGVTTLDLAHAMDLCQTAEVSPSKETRTWGLLSASFLTTTGQTPGAAQLADFQGWQSAVLASYGGIAPKVGATMVGLSTGHMRDTASPGYVAPKPGTDLGWADAPPAAYLAAHGGALPSSNGCNGVCPSGSGAHDGILLRLSVRVPTNAMAFSYDYRFATGEYPERVCTPANDFFLSLLTTATFGIPSDKNIVFDTMGHPPSINNAFFGACSAQGCATCPLGPDQLAGTGMSADTGWLTVDAPIAGGEVMTLDLTVFDVSDGAGDTSVILDGFRWHESTGFGWCPGCY